MNMRQKQQYRTVNLKPSDFNQLEELAALLSNQYAKVNLGSLVAQLVEEKLNQLQK